MSEITEALLEMVFLRPLVELFAEHFGARYLRVLKPSARDEAYLGFDQGWVRTERPMDELRQHLAESVQGRRQLGNFVGYFLQFKVVEQLVRPSKFMPTRFTVPYYRSEMSLTTNIQTGISQHETLRRLKRGALCDVLYACPMLFDLDDVYSPSLDQLRLVPIEGAPEYGNPQERHFIAFQTCTSEPYWCSEATPAHTVAPKVWVAQETAPNLMSPQQTLRWLLEIEEVLGSRHLPTTLTLIELSI